MVPDFLGVGARAFPVPVSYAYDLLKLVLIVYCLTRSIVNVRFFCFFFTCRKSSNVDEVRLCETTRFFFLFGSLNLQKKKKQGNRR